MDYDAAATASFYDRYADREWDRLESTPWGRLQAVVLADFVREFVRPGDRVLDIGAGPGRFSIVAAECGATITVADLSPGQLDRARARIRAAGLSARIESFQVADVSDLRNLPDGGFDVVLCLGGALSYVLGRRQIAAAELVRVTRPSGTILVSAMSRHGTAASVVRQGVTLYLRQLRASHLEPMIATGDQPPFPSRSGGDHPAMHLYSARELAALFTGCELLAMAGSNVTISEGIAVPKHVLEPEYWDTVVATERALNRLPGLIESGSHLVAAFRTAPSRTDG